MDPLSIAVVGWSITAVGWLMSALASKVVNKSLEAWAKNNGLGDEFKTLMDQLLKLDTLFTSFRGLRTNNSSLKKLVEELQQLAYGAEHLLDELDYYRLEDQIKQRDQIQQKDASSAPDVTGSNLSLRMKELAEQLEKSAIEVCNAVGTESNVITTQNTESQIEATKLRQTTSLQTAPKIFGRIQDRDQLMNLLKSEKPAKVGKVPIVAIVGSGGVGKTTLAQLVFHDPEVCKRFQANRFWIYVSSQFDIDRLTREMLEVACGNRYGKFDNFNNLQEKLKDGLVSKRFLLVLDDMWELENKSDWDTMVAPLKDCMVKGSIILVTSRSKIVAEMVNARDTYNLKGLGKDDFSKLLSTCIFNHQNYGDKESLRERLRKIGQQFADKLEGNPLAAKTVGYLLKKKPLDLKFWIETKNREKWISQSGPDDIMPTLRISYEHMPIHLQRCFSYCAMLPEDHTFTCEELVYLWMAQGFLNVRSEGKTMEDIGSDYFNDLLNRGFFQSKPSACGGLVSYTFHDHLLHHFARIVSIEECLRINGTEKIRQRIPPTIRHLSIFNCIERSGEEISKALVDLKRKNLSTIVNWDILPSDIFQCICDLLKKTQFVRAMRITLCSQLQPINLSFQNFVSLRYLGLIMPNSNTCNTLPKEICRLYHLEVFEIEGKLLELPNNFSNLVSLRHFLVDGKLHSKIQSVGNLTSLQELNYFDVQKKIGFEIEQLGSLKEIGGSLHIRNLENVECEEKASMARLAEKEKLDALYLQWNHGAEENKRVLEGLKPSTDLTSLTIDGYGGVASPTWLDPSLFILESITLKGCGAWELLPPIGEWEFLKHLTLSGLAVRKIGPQCYGTPQSTIFPSLEELEIIDMPYLENWVWSDQPIPLLKKLTIKSCDKLVDLPLLGCSTSEVVLKRFPSLETLRIEHCPLICQLPQLPFSSLLSDISIVGTQFINFMLYHEDLDRLGFDLTLKYSSSLKLGEVLAFHELSSLRVIEITNFSSLESLELNSFVNLVNLDIRECQSLTSITFGDHLDHLRFLTIMSCNALISMKGLKSWVNLERLLFRKCPGFIAAWDYASREIERTEPDFSLSLTTIDGDSLALLTLSICKQLTSLENFKLECSTTEEPELSLQLLTTIDLVDISGYKNLPSFPFHLFRSLKQLRTEFPRIQSLSTDSETEIAEECLKLRNIEEVRIFRDPIQIIFELSLKEMTCQQMDADN